MSFSLAHSNLLSWTFVEAVPHQTVGGESAVVGCRSGRDEAKTHLHESESAVQNGSEGERVARNYVEGTETNDPGAQEVYHTVTVSPTGTKNPMDVSMHPSHFAVLVDNVSTSLVYAGRAALGSATSAAVWQIQRAQTVGTVTTVAYADGDADFDNVWDNRASLTYV